LLLAGVLAKAIELALAVQEVLELVLDYLLHQEQLIQLR
jgi:hypothetical protein